MFALLRCPAHTARQHGGRVGPRRTPPGCTHVTGAGTPGADPGSGPALSAAPSTVCSTVRRHGLTGLLQAPLLSHSSSTLQRRAETVTALDSLRLSGPQGAGAGRPRSPARVAGSTRLSVSEGNPRDPSGTQTAGMTRQLRCAAPLWPHHVSPHGQARVALPQVRFQIHVVALDIEGVRAS